jgi:hypothetical protein
MMSFKLVWGNRYVVVMIEHFSKWIELVPIPERRLITSLQLCVEYFAGTARLQRS